METRYLTLSSCLDVFAHRLKPQLQNVRYWCETSKVPTLQIRVGTGYKPQLTLTVNKFVPLDQELLYHTPWRVKEQSITRIPSEPWALWSDILTETRLNEFMDDMIPELLREESFQRKDKLWVTTFEAAYARSKITTENHRQDVRHA